ncbi:MAG: hypothetical protein QF718_06005 [Phycisphaerales bacterium]|jgi:hypothetical protein|nr:hypothetical protein [Phycisphaerales bacterium]
MKYLISLLVSSMVMGETWMVPSECQTIQAAIDEAKDGDTILVSVGVWKERIDISGRTLQILSEMGAEETVIDGGKQGTVITSTSGNGVIVEGFTIRNGNSKFGGGTFLLNSAPTFRLCMFDFNTAENGGGVYAQGGNPIFEQCTFSFNCAKQGDGIWAKHSRPELTACIFAGDSIGWESGEMVTVRDTNSPAGACCIRDVCVQTASVACWEAGGIYRGEATTCVEACDPICDEDVTGDGVVNLTDVLRVISAFGFCP